MSYGLIAVIIVIGIVIGAIATKKCEPFLIGGSIIGAIFLYKQDFITEWVNTLEGVMSDEAYLIQIICLAVTLVMYLAEKLMTFTEYWDNFVKGFADMLPIIILLIAALTFQTMASQMQMTEFFIDITQPILSAKIFPMLAFIITGILAFMIANAWGVCTLVAPVLLPLGASVGANAILIMAAILSGCAFGNHACFYCDTTVLASQGSGIDNFDHAVSQLPYVLIGAGISIIGFLVLGFVM